MKKLKKRKNWKIINQKNQKRRLKMILMDYRGINLKSMIKLWEFSDLKKMMARFVLKKSNNLKKLKKTWILLHIHLYVPN